MQMTIQDLQSQNLILFEVISGSRSFGLDTPTSDTDIKGVFYMPKDQFYGLTYIPQISNETNDIVYYELGRFVELLLKNNPNILEMLATPADCILYQHPLMEHLKITDFLSKLCKDSFAGYAMTQIKKARGLQKKIVTPMAKERKSLLDFCYILQGHTTIHLKQWLNSTGALPEHCGLVAIPHSRGLYAVFYDASGTLGYKGIVKNELSNDVSLSSIPKGTREVAYLSFHLDHYSQYCKNYAEYWDWVAKRNAERYATNRDHGKPYDSKNMMHTVRLLQTAARILATGTLTLQVPNRAELLSIKAGAVAYDDLMEQATGLIATIAQHYLTSTLPENPDTAKALRVLIEIREALYES